MRQTNKTAIRIENCIDNRKNMMVLKMTQFDATYDVIMTSYFDVIMTSPL